MIQVPLTQGLFALIDDGDAWICERNWCALRKKTLVYACRAGATRHSLVYMHRVIAAKYTDIEGKEVDHRNGNGLDNRWTENLRVATRRQNLQNKVKQRKGGSSQYKGVSYVLGTWHASICVRGVGMSLGQFKLEVDAACAYDEAARKHFGEFARLNFPRPGEQGCLDR